MITLATTRDGNSAWIVNERSVAIGRIEYVHGKYKTTVGVGGKAAWFREFGKAIAYVNNYAKAIERVDKSLRKSA